jgi:hypothetical protein
MKVKFKFNAFGTSVILAITNLQSNISDEDLIAIYPIITGVPYDKELCSFERVYDEKENKN